MSAGSVNDEMKKVTHYAEEFETGNINYIQFLVYLSSVRENLNEILGATGKEYGGIVKQEQVRSILGEPQEETKWVWVENENREKKLEDDVPIWKKIVFDGKKIRITLSAHPSIFKKKSPELKEKIRKLKDEEKIEEVKLLEKEGEDILVYRLNFEKEFKKPKDQLDIKSKIDNIQLLAEDFNSNPSKGNAEKLAKESVNAERTFESFFKQNQGKCEDTMSSIFGSENKRDDMKTMVQEISFYEGENFEAMMRLEMCDDCEWNWININMWMEGRGKFNPPEMKDSEKDSRERYRQMTSEEFKAETIELIESMTISLEQEDYSSAMSSSQKLMTLTEAWNEVANNVWEEIDKIYKQEEESMSEEERQDMWQNYGWIAREQERRGKEKELRQISYEERKNFYLGLFAGYEKKEFYFEQKEFEKRLVQEFKTFGKEICDNNEDDNDDGQIDCSDSQCGGKLCGKLVNVGAIENETFESVTELYCIAGTCQQKEFEEIMNTNICGNNICEGNETFSCMADCVSCSTYDAINCSGKVIFSGEDASGCPLAPICIGGEESCVIDDDCTDPLCGDAVCSKGLCIVRELKECSESQCVDGAEKINKCGSGEEIISEFCIAGVWKSTGKGCGGEIGEEVVEENIVSNECSVKEDCGGVDDVCSNGKCVTIPKLIEVEESYEEINLENFIDEEKIQEGLEEIEKVIEEQQKEEKKQEKEQSKEMEKKEEYEEKSEGQTEVAQEKSEEQNEDSSQNSESVITGGFIFNFFRTITGKMTGSTITSFAIEGEEDSPQDEVSIESSDVNEDSTRSIEPENNQMNDGNNECPEAGEPPKVEDNCWWKERRDDRGCVSGYDVECGEEGNKEENKFEDKMQNDEGQWQEDCDERCGRECNDRLVKPCVDKCIRESKCLDKGECDKTIIETCEIDCKANVDIDTCAGECVGKCKKGENTWIEPEWEEPKQEQGVFSAGGGCRTSQGKTESFIWFNGWGVPFEDIQPLKNKYYQGGEADWCKLDLENLIKQRREFEKGLNEEFARWFFEDYIANTAEDWEQSQSGIYELYWNVVDNSRQIVERMNCLRMEEIPFDYNLLNFSYETDYGSVEYWEEIQEIKTDKFFGEAKEFKGNENVKIITPYMKVWIFPPKEFIKYELKKAMKEQSFPGSPEDKMDRDNEGGLTEEEKEQIKQNEAFMKKIGTLSDKYGGNVDAVVQFKDLQTENENVVFNLYVQINEEEVISFVPMLPEEVPEEDIKIELDFDTLYELIYTSEKEMGGENIESPEWAKRNTKPMAKLKEIKEGIGMFMKVRSMINDAEITPKEAEKDVDKLFKDFLWMMMMRGGMGNDKGPDSEGMKDENVKEIEEGLWDDKGIMTGEVIL